ncbi:MAG: Trm112 family protein [Verrucomicrobiae bacterium]|nr:Trm112 family protein [Verrucomicrobiae bacterium]
MKLSASILSILRCPETRQSLLLASAEQIAAMQEALPGKNIAEALVREDKQCAYPIDDGFPVLLLDRQLRRPDGGSW